jgi:hypothetical protein
MVSATREEIADGLGDALSTQRRSAGASPLSPASGSQPKAAATIAGPWRFEPHNAFGATIVGERMPFGYISTPECAPLFELDHFFDVPYPDLLDAAQKMVAAPDLIAAAELALEYIIEALNEGPDDAIQDNMKRDLAHVEAALAKARGEQA